MVMSAPPVTSMYMPMRVGSVLRPKSEALRWNSNVQGGPGLLRGWLLTDMAVLVVTLNKVMQFAHGILVLGFLVISTLRRMPLGTKSLWSKSSSMVTLSYAVFEML